VPRRALAGRGRFALRGAPIVLAAGASDADFAAALRLRDALERRCGARLPVECHARSDDLGPCLALRREGDAGEAYRLRVAPDGVLAVGQGPGGLLYAVETLAQLADGRGRLPACEIEDAPDLALRGLMLDVSRGKVPTLASLERLCDLCLRLKLNVLMLYTEHVFRFRRHPEIGSGASPFRAEELRALDAYAAARHVELVPTLQSLGHMEHILRLPRYAALDESGRGWTLSPAEPGSYALLRDLYDEYLPNFRSRFFNANCDEPWDLGTGRSRARAEAIGRGGVFVEHVKRVGELARAHDRRLMIWGDVVHQHPEQVGALDRDVVLLDWWYEAECDYDRVRAFREHGLDFVVCPGTSSWNALFPRVANSEANVARWAAAARRHGALGLVCTDWGDGGHYNLLGNSYFALAWAAQQAWSGDVPARHFDRAFSRAVLGDERGEAAACWRELGAVHETGFQVANASPLQFLFFDDVDRAYFLQGVRPALARRGLARLRRARERVRRASFPAEPLAREELLYAADASLLALDKALVAREWLAWRHAPGRLDARGRRRLAERLRTLAREQAALGRRLHRLWLARSRASNFEITRRRLDASIRSLRRAARAAARGAPPPPPEPVSDYAPGAVLAAVRSTLAGAGAAGGRKTSRARPAR
jgi:hypothetical protein